MAPQARAGVSTLSLMLLAIGIAGLAGTMLIGRFLAWGQYRTLVLAPLAMAVIALALVAFGGWMPAVFVLLGLWGCWRRPHPPAGGRGSPWHCPTMPRPAAG